MPTTTIRIEDALKARIAAAAKRAGKTAHAFIVDAIAQTVEQVELDDEFHRVADERWAKLLATGKSVSWDDARSWVEARARGDRVKRPQPRSLGIDRPHGPRRTRA
jgi:predicted transcriptional regulator